MSSLFILFSGIFLGACLTLAGLVLAIWKFNLIKKPEGNKIGHDYRKKLGKQGDNMIPPNMALALLKSFSVVNEDFKRDEQSSPLKNIAADLLDKQYKSVRGVDETLTWLNILLFKALGSATTLCEQALEKDKDLKTFFQRVNSSEEASKGVKSPVKNPASPSASSSDDDEASSSTKLVIPKDIGLVDSSFAPTTSDAARILLNRLFASMDKIDALGPVVISYLRLGSLVPLIQGVRLLEFSPSHDKVSLEVDCTFVDSSTAEISTSVQINAPFLGNVASIPIQAAVCDLYFRGTLCLDLNMSIFNSSLDIGFKEAPTVDFDIATVIGHDVQLVNIPHVKELLQKFLLFGINKELVGKKKQLPLFDGLKKVWDNNKSVIFIEQIKEQQSKSTDLVSTPLSSPRPIITSPVSPSLKSNNTRTYSSPSSQHGASPNTSASFLNRRNLTSLSSSPEDHDTNNKRDTYAHPKEDNSIFAPAKNLLNNIFAATASSEPSTPYMHNE